MKKDGRVVPTLKAAAWSVLAGCYYYSGLPLVLHRGRVAILTYHRVVSDDLIRTEHIQSGMYVRAQSFEAHIEYLRRQFVILPLEDLVQMWHADRLDRQRSYCVLTFDDGWRDNYQYAFPVLKKHSLPATIFLATDYVGTSRWFWPDQVKFLLEQSSEHMTVKQRRKALATVVRETLKIDEPSAEKLCAQRESDDPIDSDALIEGCKRLDLEVIQEFVGKLSRALVVDLPSRRVLLDWEEVRIMADQGVTFGSHSCSHRIMTQIPLEEARKEMVESRHAMLLHGIKPVPVFCYPNGNCDQSLKALARDSGYLAAVGCEIGLEGHHPHDQFALKRIGLHEDATASASLFALSLSGLR